jgi:hypothetical protein
MNTTLSRLATVALLALAGGFAGCDKSAQLSPAAAGDINQQDLCYTNNFAAGDAAKLCKPGQKIVFVPNSGSGTDQVAVMFAAANCDYRYAVVMSTTAVSCIYNPLRRNDTSGPAASGAKP